MRQIVLCLALAAPAAGGCDKGESKPNPEMKVPDVPPGRGGGAAEPKALKPR